MYTLCFFRNWPEASWTFCAKPLCTFFAVKISTLVAPLPGAIPPIKDEHLRKSSIVSGTAWSSSLLTYPGDVRRLSLYFAFFRTAVGKARQYMLRM